eukprot:10705953-Alexandrium_andersonii.AAC.1
MARPPSPHPTHPPLKSLKQTRLRLSGPLRQTAPLRARPRSMTEDKQATPWPALMAVPHHTSPHEPEPRRSKAWEPLASSTAAMLDRQ